MNQILLTVNDVAKRLQVHPQSVYRWIYETKLECTRIHSVVRITEEQLEKFIKGYQ